MREETRKPEHAIYHYDIPGDEITWNESISNITGYDHENINGPVKKWFNLIHPEDRVLAKNWSNTNESRYSHTYRVKTIDGTYILIYDEGMVIHHTDGYSGMMGTITPVYGHRSELKSCPPSPDTILDIINHLPDPTFAIDAQGRVTVWNNAMAEMSGIPADQIIGKGDQIYSSWIYDTPRRILVDYVLHNDIETLKTTYPHLHFQGNTVISESRMKQSDGSFRYLWISATPLIGPDGTITGAMESLRDVTHQKKNNQKLIASQKYLLDIINFLPEPTFSIDAKGEVIAWNYAIEKMSGILAKDIIGKGDHAYSEWLFGKRREILIDYVLHQNRETIQEKYPHIRAVGDAITAESERQLPDGTTQYLWITATPLISPTGEIFGAIESLRDVTHQKSAQKALRDAKKYLDAIINSIADPVYVKDRDHRWVLVNNACCQLFGRTREELIGISEYDLYPAAIADRIHASDEQVFETGTVTENEEEIIDASGQLHTNISKKTIYVNLSGARFLVGVIRDITERKDMEKALRLANEKLNILSSITRHDILNSLTALLGYLEFSKDLVQDNEVLAGYHQKELSIAEAIRHQIEFTKFYQDIGVKAPGWQNVTDTIRMAVHQLHLVNVLVNDQCVGLEIFADALIGKVFFNLLENSVRHGERVTIITCSYHEDESGLILRYSDDGIGVPVDEKEKIFRQGFGKHTGFGMFLTKEILAITGITITENGIPGKGVQFDMHVARGKYRFP